MLILSFLFASCKSLSNDVKAFHSIDIYDKKESRTSTKTYTFYSYQFFDWDLKKSKVVKKVGFCNVDKDTVYLSELGVSYSGEIKYIDKYKAIVSYFEKEGGLDPVDSKTQKYSTDTINLKKHFEVRQPFKLYRSYTLFELFSNRSVNPN